MEKDILKAFGDRIRLFRNRLGLSQEALAEKAGLHRTYVGGIERGERNVSLLNIVCISKALQTTPAELLSFECEKVEITK